MKLVVTSFMTLDGIVEAPGLDEHRTGRNAWALRVQGDEDQLFNKEHVLSADALPEAPRHVPPGGARSHRALAGPEHRIHR